MHQPSLPLWRTLPQGRWGGEAVEGVESLPRQQWGVEKGAEQREEMNLTKEVLLAARRETPMFSHLSLSSRPLARRT